MLFWSKDRHQGTHAHVFNCMNFYINKLLWRPSTTMKKQCITLLDTQNQRNIVFCLVASWPNCWLDLVLTQTPSHLLPNNLLLFCKIGCIYPSILFGSMSSPPSPRSSHSLKVEWAPSLVLPFWTNYCHWILRHYCRSTRKKSLSKTLSKKTCNIVTNVYKKVGFLFNDVYPNYKHHDQWPSAIWLRHWKLLTNKEM